MNKTEHQQPALKIPTYSVTVYRGYEIAVNLTRTKDPSFRIERVVVRHRLSTHSKRLRINGIASRDFPASELAFKVAIARAEDEIQKVLSKQTQERL
jgi:predicted transcriptional regulator